MQNSWEKNARKSSGARLVNGIAIRTRSVSEGVAEALRGLSAKRIAERLKTNLRTVENWKQKKTTPQAKHVAAILNDEELCGPFLREMGRPDLAHQHEIKTLERRIEALKQAEQRHREHTNEIRTDLEAARTPDPLGSGQVQRRGDGAAQPGGAAEKPGEEGGE